MTDLRLTPDEILDIAAGLTVPRRQLHELHKQGFWRARLDRAGKVLLERAHYEAVCQGAAAPNAPQEHTKGRPQLRPIQPAIRQ